MKKNTRLTKISLEEGIKWIILFTGITLSLIQFLYNRSLWLDEAKLALNIVNRDFFQLFQPLGNEQIAPILFLLAEKLFTLILPGSEYGLRIFVLLCYITTLGVFFLIIKTTFRNPYTTILALSLFVFNPKLIYYSSEVKQYMCDVLVIVSMYYVTMKQYRKPVTQVITLASLGSVSIFLSSVAPVVLATTGAYLLYDKIRSGYPSLKSLATVFSAWLIFFIVYYIAFIHNHPTREFMVRYWNDLNAFFSFQPFEYEFYKNIFDRLYSTTRYLLSLDGIYITITLLFTFLGIISLVKDKKTGLSLLLVLPVLIHFALSSLRLYPFHNRLVLYLVIPLILLITQGFKLVLEITFNDLNIKRFRLLAFIIPLLLASFFFRKDFPFTKEEIKPSIEYILQNMEKDDNLYLYSGAVQAFNFYRSSFYERYHCVFENLNIYPGKKHRYEPKGYIEEITKLHGNTWLLFSHVAFASAEKSEEDYIISNLKERSYHIKKSFHAMKGSSVYLVSKEQ